jgi:Tol biopolymer transport system component
VTVGPYEIVDSLGSGGMGEVYRARDPRLNRHVAIKILAPHLAADATALARFEREAQALAALSHPGIVAVYDVGRQDGSTYVVMELLQGETLRARLAGGPLGFRKAIGCAIQMAHALSAAHERGIVHRDLKPENVFVASDGRISILDFGIARLTEEAASSVEETGSPGASHTTARGRIVGSIRYMSPEQVRAQPVDARSDIFALGCVIYEMIAGRRAFDGDTAADVIAALLDAEPPPVDAARGIPPALDRIVRICLEKRPAERFQSARDVAFALDAVASGSPTIEAAMPAGPIRRAAWWVVAAVALVASAAGLAAGRLLLAPAAPAVQPAAAVRFTIDANRGEGAEIAVSPDGTRVAWTELSSGGRVGGIWVRRLDNVQPTLLADTSSAAAPFWTADGREIVVPGLENRLLAIDVDSGGRRIVAELGADELPMRGGDWVAGTLLLGLGGAIVRQDPADHGVRRAVTTPAAPREAWHGWPALLPDGRRFLYTVGLGAGGTETRLASIDGSGSRRVDLPASTSRVRYDSRGFLVFAQNRRLVAQRFDADTGALVGSPVRLAFEVFQNPVTGWVSADASPNGVVAWRAPGVDEVQFELVDRGGRTVGTIGEPDAYTNFDVSPDGSRIVTTRRRRSDTASGLFLIDITRNLTTPLVDRAASQPISDPTWSPDGRQIAYRRGTQLVVRNAFGGEERALTDWAAYPDTWSRDGRYLTVGRPRDDDYQLWAYRMDGRTEEIPLVQGVPLADEARFSPDGRWVAFHAALQGTPEVFAVRFPPTGERWQLSIGGGVQPRWRGDGQELYYLGPEGDLIAVAVPRGDPTRARRPERLFGLRLVASPAFDQYQPLDDGARFVVRRPLRPGGSDTAPVTVMVNWTSLAAPATR